MRIVTISSKNQITLPKKDLDELAIKPSSKLIVEKQKGGFFLRPVKGSIVHELAGSLKPYVDPKKLGVPFEKVMKETIKIVTKDLAENH
ncbi:MAG: hypothetical protein A2700_00430 [Candidatus Blackburnbacteria bacterium RIFCSPHIGHO2_01_FULL_44_64]|uniref:SpoVT-AbrB domain-containing protein n=1 Tax=Candidatus Blackburnbacteria bacterium RIFCSPHIGHO2_02_FULL_44_20 TaxID=1797516 RepID=A0A1G1V609_9BACT|nr:MAG: hypothetical protein A2700_00430 [Candidatus Blackburnbacteria bacterium RIFCSPHIGHO2_01_FULL_44_64]OGY10741.1 MAG: hypothetical protein A3D26_02780 [Candidatus Blackburnbacteria bacterium RIFCSPHIGHO2_02_FULL_44_20]OGY11905.1 MAG: hypothetical protein A3E16_03895 [Candidatus Blackburnbacteria bacterium RIFCSPHIGHO2_12_FULL_44_25]OGY13628.1 MAG: hypothetical protein A3A62_00095 [Candidatus Blackburnbacteria bacterium RIFCSPLOWO2_01_FULL_44_43]OGY17077.1 MAG: hypothetical protein A3H88_0